MVVECVEALSTWTTPYVPGDRCRGCRIDKHAPRDEQGYYSALGSLDSLLSKRLVILAQHIGPDRGVRGCQRLSELATVFKQLAMFWRDHLVPRDHLLQRLQCILRLQ